MILAKFRPSPEEFQPVEYVWKGAGPAVTILNGDNATLVGWIPFYESEGQLPEGVLRDRYGADSSVAMILGSGNQEPPAEFSNGRPDLLRYLALRDFRGAVSIDAPRLHVDRDGKPAKVQFDAISRVGTTPARGSQMPFLPSSITCQLGGVSASYGYIGTEGERVWIRVFLRMKIGLIGQLIARTKTGYWPPWATLSIEYRFDLESSRSEILFAGTSIPSQSRFVEWNNKSTYQMDYTMSEAAYDGFIQAGSCQDAMTTPHLETSWLTEVGVG